MNLTPLRHPRLAARAGTPQPMPADPPDPESRRLWEAESEARATFMLALTGLLVAHGRVQRHQAQRDSLGSQKPALPVSDTELEALADDYVERNVSLLSAIPELQFWDILDDRMFPRESTEEAVGQALPSRRRPEGSPHVNPTSPSPATREAVPLDGQAQKWHDYCLVPVTCLARSLAHDEGFEGADCAEVETAAARALAHAAASYRPDGLLARPFWSYMLGVVYPAMFETMRHLRVRREEFAASHGLGGGDSPGPQRPVSPLPV